MNLKIKLMIGRTTNVKVNINGVRSLDDFEFIDIVDDTNPYPTLLGIKWDFTIKILSI